MIVRAKERQQEKKMNLPQQRKAASMKTWVTRKKRWTIRERKVVMRAGKEKTLVGSGRRLLPAEIVDKHTYHTVPRIPNEETAETKGKDAMKIDQFIQEAEREIQFMGLNASARVVEVNTKMIGIEEITEEIVTNQGGQTIEVRSGRSTKGSDSAMLELELGDGRKKGGRKKKATHKGEISAVRRSARVNSGEHSLSTKERTEQRPRIRSLEMGGGFGKGSGLELGGERVMGSVTVRNTPYRNIAAEMADEDIVDVVTRVGFKLKENEELRTVEELRRKARGPMEGVDGE